MQLSVVVYGRSIRSGHPYAAALHHTKYNFERPKQRLYMAESHYVQLAATYGQTLRLTRHLQRSPIRRILDTRLEYKYKGNTLFNSSTWQLTL